MSRLCKTLCQSATSESKTNTLEGSFSADFEFKRIFGAGATSLMLCATSLCPRQCSNTMPPLKMLCAARAAPLMVDSTSVLRLMLPSTV